MKKLTKKQQEVEDLLLTGLSIKQIAYKLGIQYDAVASRKYEIFKKREVHSIGELLALRFSELISENKRLKKHIEQLTVYKQRWEYLRNMEMKRG